jgi:hypothetical protein
VKGTVRGRMVHSLSLVAYAAGVAGVVAPYGAHWVAAVLDPAFPGGPDFFAFLAHVGILVAAGWGLDRVIGTTRRTVCEIRWSAGRRGAPLSYSAGRRQPDGGLGGGP